MSEATATNQENLTNDQLLTVAQVAERLNVSESYVRDYLLLKKRLPKVKLGPGKQGKIRIAESDLNAYIAASREAAQ